MGSLVANKPPLLPSQTTSRSFLGIRAGGGGGASICGASQSKQAGRDTHGCAAVGEGVHADRAAQLV